MVCVCVSVCVRQFFIGHVYSAIGKLSVCDVLTSVLGTSIHAGGNRGSTTLNGSFIPDYREWSVNTGYRNNLWIGMSSSHSLKIR